MTIQRRTGVRFPPAPPGYLLGMDLSLILIVLGIIVAFLVSDALGILMIVIGLVLLVWPRITARA